MSFIFMHKREERAGWKCHFVIPTVTESVGTLMLETAESRKKRVTSHLLLMLFWGNGTSKLQTDRFCHEYLKHTQRALLNGDLEVTDQSLSGFRPDD